MAAFFHLCFKLNHQHLANQHMYPLHKYNTELIKRYGFNLEGILHIAVPIHAHLHRHFSLNTQKLTILAQDLCAAVTLADMRDIIILPRYRLTKVKIL